MATLELAIDEGIAIAPVARKRRLGPLFWAAIGWMIFISSRRHWRACCRLPVRTDMDMLERRTPASMLHWLGTGWPRARTNCPPDLWSADIAHGGASARRSSQSPSGGALGMLAGYFRGRL